MTPEMACSRILARLQREAGCNAMCTLRMRYDVPKRRTVYQHGDNPEAIYLLDDRTVIESKPGVSFWATVDWIKSVHTYDNGWGYGRDNSRVDDGGSGG